MTTVEASKYSYFILRRVRVKREFKTKIGENELFISTYVEKKTGIYRNSGKSQFPKLNTLCHCASYGNLFFYELNIAKSFAS